MWAVMQNRYDLVKVLWKYSDHPIHLALIISVLFKRLSLHVYDTNLKLELEQRSQQFATYAYDVLDRCYNENMTLAYNALRESVKEWNYMTAVDIAAIVDLKEFIAHPCCQKWLTNTFQGQIRIRELTWGMYTVPNSLKILLCCLLVFPMYIWIRFKEDESNESKQNEDEELDVYDNMYKNIELKNIDTNILVEDGQNSNKICTKTCYINKAFMDNTNENSPLQRRIYKGFKRSNRNYHEVFVKKQPPLWRMITIMWCAPISKFYMSQFFYIIFLVTLSLTALYPNCGHQTLDSIISIWSLLIAITNIRSVYVLVFKYSSISLYSKLMETVLILSFTFVFAITRVFKIYFFPVYWQKVILAFAVVYFYYRLIYVYLPISPTLGPLFYRFRAMLLVDFINYMRISTVILMANAIALQTLRYPYEDLTIESIRKAIHKSFLAFFVGPPVGKIS